LLRGASIRYVAAMRYFFIIFFFLSAVTGQASEFCQQRTAEALPTTLASLMKDPAMRLAFENEGGLFDGGVCWWHSRFQRAVWYLADFAPERPAPTRKQASVLIRKLISRRHVVVIPGYSDFRSFSRDFQPEIQKALNRWQIRDAVINQAYLRGLAGKTQFHEPKRLQARMDKIFRRYTRAKAKGDVLWLMLQMHGIDSHASLLQSMEALPGGGYRLSLVDSNFPDELVPYTYQPGDLELSPQVTLLFGYESSPYVGFSRDLNRIHRALVRACPAK
jgi:hypothetical protein